MKNLITVLFAIVLSGCISANVSEPSICSTVDLGTIPASPVSFQLPPTTFSKSFDFSKSLSKVSDVANDLTVSVSQLTIDNNGDLSWVSAMSVSIEGQDSTHPLTPFATFNPADVSDQTISLQVVMNSDQLLNYLMSGPVIISVTLSGSAPTTKVDLSNTLCVAASGSFSESP
jgi:hypothetical protein